MYLYIESLESKKVLIAVFDSKKIIHTKRAAVFSDKILETVVSVIGRRSWRSLEGVIVHQGPGAGSAVRSGVLLANTLSAVLGIPVVAVHDDFDFRTLPQRLSALLSAKNIAPVRPIYNREPNITVAKNKSLS